MINKHNYHSNSIINNLKLPYQNDSSSPDNGILIVVGVKVVDPEDGHEEDQDHDGSKDKTHLGKLR